MTSLESLRPLALLQQFAALQIIAGSHEAEHYSVMEFQDEQLASTLLAAINHRVR